MLRGWREKRRNRCEALVIPARQPLEGSHQRARRAKTPGHKEDLVSEDGTGPAPREDGVCV